MTGDDFDLVFEARPVSITRSHVRRALARRGRGGARERQRVTDLLSFVMELPPKERRALGLSPRERGELWRGVDVCRCPWQQLWREMDRLERALGWERRATLFAEEGAS